MHEKTRIEQADFLVVAIAEHFRIQPEGGILHLVLGDCNYEDDDVDQCLLTAHEQEDWGAVVIASLLLEFTKEERETICEYPERIDAQLNGVVWIADSDPRWRVWNHID